MASFLEDVNQMVIDAVYQDIAEQLLEDWINNNLDEGSEYAEFKFMEFASNELRQQYNEYYGYKEGDDYFLC
jgi:hypothetical protein